MAHEHDDDDDDPRLPGFVVGVADASSRLYRTGWKRRSGGPGSSVGGAVGVVVRGGGIYLQLIN